MRFPFTIPTKTPWALQQAVTANLPCPLTGSQDALVIGNRARSLEPLRTVINKQSGLVYVDPQPSNEQINKFYESEYRSLYKNAVKPTKKHIKRSAESAKKRLASLLKQSCPGMKLLDIGSGSGEFVYLAKQNGFVASGVEPNFAFSEFARNKYQIDVSTTTLAEFQQVGEAYDRITLFHVLEHLASPPEAMCQLKELLKVGGRLLIEVPNVTSTRTSPWSRWHIGHLFHFNDRTLDALARLTGFLR